MRTITFFVACCIHLGVGTLMAQASADRISGTWKGEAGPNGQAAIPISMTLKFDGKAVTGPVTGFPSPGEVKTGTFDPETGALKLQLGETSGTAVMLVFEGTVVRGTATGRVSGDGKSGTFLIVKDGEGGATAPAGPGNAGAVVRTGFEEVSAWVAKSADLVPAAKYSYKPAPTVRTFGQIIGHVADGYNYYCGRAAGRTVQWSDANEKGATDKASVVPKLKQALEVCNAAYAGTGDIGQLMANVAHTSLHYGNLITYIRMMGLVPPSS